jgi:hypothetical protein
MVAISLNLWSAGWYLNISYNDLQASIWFFKLPLVSSGVIVANTQSLAIASSLVKEIAFGGGSWSVTLVLHFPA